VKLINPTFAVVMGGLAIAKVPYERWLRFIWRYGSFVSSLWALLSVVALAHKAWLIRTFFGLDELFLLLGLSFY